MPKPTPMPEIEIPVRCRFWWHRWSVWTPDRETTFRHAHVNYDEGQFHHKEQVQMRECKDCRARQFRRVTI